MNDAIKPGPETPSQAGLPELSVVVPTFNERDNVTVLYRRLEATLAGIPWEVVFVDDNSPDGTWEVVRGLARKDSRVRCVRRIGPGACFAFKCSENANDHEQRARVHPAQPNYSWSSQRRSFEASTSPLDTR